MAPTRQELLPPPIVYTIAGSDSGGGAGIQADLHAMANFGCHGCSAITCLTAQNSVGVFAVHTPPVEFLQQQLDALISDLPPLAIKIGMLATKELAMAVGDFIKELKRTSKTKIWVVLDPVMISTSGSRLLDNEAQQALIQNVFPYVDVITPNKFEAQALLDNRILSSLDDVEQAARDLLTLGGGVSAVLIKGGHTDETGDWARDYFLAADSTTATSADDDTSSNDNEARLCDGHRGLWLQSARYDTQDTHGTGCTLSSSMAAALALGEQSRQNFRASRGGAYTALNLVDACCLAKAYVTAGIDRGAQIGQGPGPVAQTNFPASHQHYPAIWQKNDNGPGFLAMQSYANGRNTDKKDRPTLGRILPIVNSKEWVQRLCDVSTTKSTNEGPIIQDIQLRIKGETNRRRILEIVQECQAMCKKANIRLWINDYWEAAAEAGCFGVHVGQEDLVKCIEAGGLDKIRDCQMALGISTHSFGELAAALAVKPTYISLGPVFATGSKKVGFDPQGLDVVSKWRQLVPPDVPFVVIGGIGDANTAALVRSAGADGVAVIGAITASLEMESIALAVRRINQAME